MNALIKAHVDKIVFSSEGLSRLDPGEREKIIVCCHIFNEISILMKLVAWTAPNYNRAVSIDDLLSISAQCSFVIRIMSAKLFEAQIFFEKLFATYESQRKPLEVSPLRELWTAWNCKVKKNDVMALMRNKVTFHYDLMQGNDLFERTDKTANMIIYDGGQVGNKLFLFADYIIGTAFSTERGKNRSKADLQLDFDRQTAEVRDLGGALQRFILELVSSSEPFRRIIGGCEISAAEISKGDLMAIKLPYFVTFGTE